MSDVCETVAIVTENGPVEIIKSDFDAKIPMLSDVNEPAKKPPVKRRSIAKE